ncbi:MAG: L,D-transpeptidase [Clostridiales bacterium]|nr:L,D-transpeptidase [Clostridiales bacterium]
MFHFESTKEGVGTLSLMNQQGQTLFVILQSIPIQQGENLFMWNGMDNIMKPIEEGIYTIALSAEGETITHTVHVGKMSPQVTQMKLQDSQITPGDDWNMSVNVNMPGTLAVVFHVGHEHYTIFHEEILEGKTDINWDGMLTSGPAPAGKHTLTVVFLDETGFAANQQHITLDVNESKLVQDSPEEFTPKSTELTPSQKPADAQSAPPVPEEAYRYTVPTKEVVTKEDYGKDFWRLPVGDYDEEAIWKVMMQPITVLWGKDQRDTYKLRATRDDSSKRDNILGEVGYESQGVHVIEQYDDGWSLVEVYNSSYGPNNRTRRGYGDTDDLIRGYIRTSELKVITPRDDYGLLIDKLKQRLYVFQNGKIITELMISTGIPTKQQPWNETPSGEFLMVSRTGDFNAGNLVCRMSMRINGGALIHEVPYILNERTGYWDYSSQESQLGKKASHGCIRVQRVNNNDGINMTWLWNNIKVNTKVLVWDDDNRYYEYPDANLPLFFNPQGGKYYHADQNCRSIKDRYLPLEGALVYSELDNQEHSKLTPCPHCNPPLRSSKIDQINKDNGF